MALPVLNTPTYELVIPSTKKSIEYRPYTVKEEKILLLAKESKDAKSMIRASRDLIRACTFNKLDTNMLTMFDFEYIFLQLRGKSVGETSDIQAACKSCDKYNDININIEEGEVKGELNRDMKVMVDDNVGIVLRFPMFKSAEVYSTDGEDVDSVLGLIVSCIESIFDQDQVYPTNDLTNKELLDFVESIPSMKFKDISAKLDDLPTVSLTAKFVCKHCEHENEIEIKGLQSFF